MPKTGFTLDTSNFDVGFRPIARKWPEYALKGYMIGVAVIIKSAILDQPTVPKKTGHLRREQKIEVTKRTTEFDDVSFGFNTVYAAYLHEAPTNWNWSETGSGPKYLTTSMISKGAEALEEAANYIKKQAK